MTRALAVVFVLLRRVLELAFAFVCLGFVLVGMILLAPILIAQALPGWLARAQDRDRQVAP